MLTREEYIANNSNKIYTKENCPFCRIDKLDDIIWKWKFWYIKHNIASYSWNEKHIMAIPYEHIKYSHELEVKHFDELNEIYKFVKDFFQEEQYFSFTRETMWNRSVEHLHIHFLIWILEEEFLIKMLELQWFPIKQELKIN